MEKSEFDTLIELCKDISEDYPQGTTFIGGIAVYLHTIADDGLSDLAEMTHDAVFYISQTDFSRLRDAEELTNNRRLQKSQLIRKGFEFDIYTERQSGLIVPYDAVRAHARHVDGINIASLEHLTVLKLGAYAERQGSAKGNKDARDIARIGLVAMSKPGFKPEICTAYLTDQHLDLLRKIPKHPVIAELANNNAKTAKALRGNLQQFADDIERLALSEIEPQKTVQAKARNKDLPEPEEDFER